MATIISIKIIKKQLKTRIICKTIFPLSVIVKRDTQRVVVNVDDVDESPKWDLIVYPYIHVVPVDAPSGASLYQLMASDPEGATVGFFLKSGKDLFLHSYIYSATCQSLSDIWGGGDVHRNAGVYLCLLDQKLFTKPESK